MTPILHDLRAAVRSLRRARGFFALAVLTLALAIAVNTALFTFLNAVFFRPLPYVAPEQLHLISLEPVDRAAFEPLEVAKVRSALAPVSDVAAYSERGFVVAPAAGATDASPALVQGTAADPSLFALLGVSPALGRLFGAADAAIGATPTVVVGESFWRARLGGGPDALGRSIRVDGVEHVVIGVMPARFSFPDFAQLWVPLPGSDAMRLNRDVDVLVRLNGAAGVARANELLEAAVRENGVQARASMNAIVPSADQLLVALLAAISFVLLIACSNVANLVLARGVGRRHELNLRAALGASRFTLIRHLAAEGSVVALAALGLGSIGSLWLTDLIVASFPADALPLWFDPAPDLRVLVYIGVIGLVVLFVTATLPALHVSRDAIPGALAQSGARTVGDGRAGRMRSSLIGVQIALATVLTAGAGLMVRALTAVRGFDTGYAADAVLQVATRRPPAASSASAFANEAVTRLAALPGVAGAGAAATSTLGGRVVAGARPDAPFASAVEAVSPTWFDAVGLALLRGRALQHADDAGDVVVISDLVARTLFGEAGDAVGRTVSFEGSDRAFAVIGVVSDQRAPVRAGPQVAAAQPHVYLPLAFGDPRDVRFHVRAAAGEPIALAPAVTGLLRELSEDLVVLAPAPLGRIVRERGGDLGLFASLFASFGAMALLIAATGIYGVVAYVVGRRTREIGVRITLGATPGHVIGHVAGLVMRPLAIGLTCGVAGALGLGMLLRSLLFGVRPADPLALALAALTFGVAAALATAVPALRAAHIDPLRALQAE